MTFTPRLKPKGPLVYGGLLGLAIGFGAWALSLPIDAQSLASLSYTEAQAARGQAAYVEHCASCHGQNLDDGAFAPPLKGADFQQKWGDSASNFVGTHTSVEA